MSHDCGKFQKVRVHVSPNDSGSIFHRVLMVFENKPPHHGATDFEEAARIQGNANRAQRRTEEQLRVVPPCNRDLLLEYEEVELPTFNSP
jgi:hypothetical protein